MSVITHIKSGIKSQINKFITAVHVIVNNIKQFLGDMYEEIVFAEEEIAEELIIRDEDLTDECTNLVYEVLGDDPLKRFANLSPEDRERAIVQIITGTSQTLCIEVNRIVVAKLEGIYGYFSFSDSSICIDAYHVLHSPMTRLEAKEVLDTLLHELRHAYQKEVIKNPNRYDIDSDIVSAWRKNFYNYIRYDLNPRLYFEQPLESDARCFALSIVNVL